MADNNQTSQQINIREYAQLLLKRKWYLIMPTIIAPLVAILTTFFMAPTFKASTSILIKESNVLPRIVQQELESTQRVRRQSSSEIRNALSSQIKSTKYIRSLITKLDFQVTDEIRQIAREQVGDMPDVSIAELAENLLIASIRKKIDVQISGSSIVMISVTSGTPIMARKMTQTIAEIFLEESLAQELVGIQGSISFTEEQLAVYREKLFNAQNRLKSFRQSMIETSVDEDTTTVNYNLNSIFSAVEALDIEIGNAEQEKDELRIALFPYQIDFSAVSLSSNLIREKQGLMGTIPRLAELLGRYSWRDGKVVALNQEAKDISLSIKNGIQDYVDLAFPSLPDYGKTDLTRYLMLGINVEFMQTKSSAMGKSIGKIKSRLSKNPDVEVTLDRLQSEVDRYRELYNLFVQHSQYAAIDQSAKKIEAESKFMIVQPAELPLEPVSPSRVKMLVLGVILGIVIGGSVIMIIVMLDDTFKKIDEIEGYLGLPVLATIPRLATPYSSKKRERGLVYIGMVISVILMAAILFMKFKNG
ncbi:MAG: hypothetical protein GY839_06490 [candidate division Zixibacteria bacterium]|nr:hypothetical protein [candidate division Zixibacteria bacterium]